MKALSAYCEYRIKHAKLSDVSCLDAENVIS